MTVTVTPEPAAPDPDTTTDTTTDHSSLPPTPTPQPRLGVFRFLPPPLLRPGGVTDPPQPPGLASIRAQPGGLVCSLVLLSTLLFPASMTTAATAVNSIFLAVPVVNGALRAADLPPALSPRAEAAITAAATTIATATALAHHPTITTASTAIAALASPLSELASPLLSLFRLPPTTPITTAAAAASTLPADAPPANDAIFDAAPDAAAPDAAAPDAAAPDTAAPGVPPDIIPPDVPLSAALHPSTADTASAADPTPPDARGAPATAADSTAADSPDAVLACLSSAAGGDEQVVAGEAVAEVTMCVRRACCAGSGPSCVAAVSGGVVGEGLVAVADANGDGALGRSEWGAAIAAICVGA